MRTAVAERHRALEYLKPGAPECRAAKPLLPPDNATMRDLAPPFPPPLVEDY